MSQNWTKIWMNSLVLSLKSAKIQGNHPNFCICNRKSSPPPICSLDELLVIRSPKRIVKDPAKDNRITIVETMGKNVLPPLACHAACFYCGNCNRIADMRHQRTNGAGVHFFPNRRNAFCTFSTPAELENVTDMTDISV